MTEESPSHEMDRIRRQMEQALVGKAWHGPSLMETLAGVDAAAAAARPLPGGHSIWEIALHLTGTQDLLLSRLQGIVKELAPEEDWPPVPEPTEAAWRRTVETLKRRDEELREHAARLPEDRLDEPLVPGGTSAYNNLHGYVQHTLYHTGQMALLKKMIAPA